MKKKTFWTFGMSFKMFLNNFLVYQSPWHVTRLWWLQSPILTFAAFSKLVSPGNCQLRSVDYVLQREIENNSSCKRVRSLKISTNQLLIENCYRFLIENCSPDLHSSSGRQNGICPQSQKSITWEFFLGKTAFYVNGQRFVGRSVCLLLSSLNA